ncbi:MAG: calcium-binding protein, partial [Aliarcobacter sp.]|nr:calcium-binding protein [Aliarcobacter sp.]
PTVIFGSNDESKDETIYTQKTNDRIYAGKGDDTIIAWGGNNLYDGGEGSDTVSYKTLQSKEGINVNLSLATAQAINSTTTDTLVNIENVIGSKYADNIIGKDNSNSIITLKGGFGNDTLTGGDNTVENKLYGEENNDYLYGGSTSDEIMLNANKLVKNYLYGGSGEDFLVASINADNELYGGDDKDILISELIGYEHSKFGVLKGSSYLNGGIGDDQYYVSDKVTIEDDDNSGEIIISRTMQKLSELKYKFSPNGTVVFYTLEPTIVTETSYPFAGLGGWAGSVLGNKGITTTRIDYNEKYLGIVSRNGNDLIIDYFDRANITIKNYNFVTGSLGLTITGDMLSDNPQTPSEPNPIVIGSDESETLVGSEVNNTYTSNKGNDTIKDTAGGNDTYNFSLGDGADTIYDIKGNDVIKFDDTILKEDITFSQSEDLKSLIINYSSTDSITITNYFDTFSKIENIQLSDGTKLTSQFNNTITGRDIAENLVTGYGNDTVTLNAGDDIFLINNEIRKVA